MLQVPKNILTLIRRYVERQIVLTYSTTTNSGKAEEFRILNLRHVKDKISQPRALRKYEVLPPRTEQMPVGQNWGNVWPGPRTFHPATVPIPVRQGYLEKKGAPPQKYANAELMKIPNFLHLTPPVIERQCEALKKFCTSWPRGLETDEKCEQHFPLEVSSSSYCHSSPTIRDPLVRIVSVKFKLSRLGLDGRAKDKFLRLAGDRYNEETDIVSIVTDRCPTRKQNYHYAMYLITALYHESLIVEPWEELKSEADIEYYDWDWNSSKASVAKLFGKRAEEIPCIQDYAGAVERYMNEGENAYTVDRYGEAVRKLLNLPLSLI